MKRVYRLIKLKAKTVQDLMRLKSQLGKGSLDELVSVMIQITDAHYYRLKNAGWCAYQRGDQVDCGSFTAGAS
jgi:hypothetical protein